MHVQAGQRVKVGAVLLSFGDGGKGGQAAAPAPAAPVRAAGPAPAASPAAAAPATGVAPAATPATRRLARELGVDLARVHGTGPGGRISDEDVRRAAGGHAAPAAAATAGAPASPAWPAASSGPAEAPRPLAAPVELPALPRFEQWGAVEREPLRGIRRRSAEHLALAWAVIPHVTQHDQADITELETMRRRHQKRGGEGVGDLTLTVFLVKAVARVLRAHPRFNASLDSAAGELVLKRYYNIGVAVDTDQGLVVPVVRGVDGKGIPELAAELGKLAAPGARGKAHAGRISGAGRSP